MGPSIKQKVYNILIRELDLPDEAVTDDADLVKDLGMDSIDTLNIQTALQMELEISLSEKEVIDISTVSQLVDVVYDKKSSH